MDEIDRTQNGRTIQNNRNSLFQRSASQSNSGSLVNATADEAASIQQSLHRTQRLLMHELDRVSRFQSAIEDDGKLLQQTMEAQKSLNVKGAKKALTALERAQQNERLVLRASIFFFWMCAFYVMWCRLLIKIPFVDRLTEILRYCIWLLLHQILLAVDSIRKFVLIDFSATARSEF